MPDWFDNFMWIVYIACLNDALLFLYTFIHPKYRFQLEFREIGLSFPYWNQKNENRIYFKMDTRKKIGTYSILIIAVYGLYIDSLLIFYSSIIIPIILHVLFLSCSR